jgi:uncharacterized protein (DUF2267 family)
MNKHEFIESVQESLQLPSPEITEEAVRVVLSLFSHRLTPNEAAEVKAQLPTALKALWQSNTWFSSFASLSNQKQLTYSKPEQLYAMIRNELDKKQIVTSVESLTQTVLHLLKEEISEGESKDIEAQLPRDIKSLWQAA